MERISLLWQIPAALLLAIVWLVLGWDEGNFDERERL